MARLEQHPTLGLGPLGKGGGLWGECSPLHQPYQQKVWVQQEPHPEAQPDSLLGSLQHSREPPRGTLHPMNLSYFETLELWFSNWGASTWRACYTTGGWAHLRL